jgi:hypothetical protein
LESGNELDWRAATKNLLAANLPLRQKSCLRGNMMFKRIIHLFPTEIRLENEFCLCSSFFVSTAKTDKMGKTWVCPTVCGGKKVNSKANRLTADGQ